MSTFEFLKTEDGFAVTCRWSEGFTTKRIYTKTDLFCPRCGKCTVFNTPDVADSDQSLCVYCGFVGFIHETELDGVAQKVKVTPLAYFETGEIGPGELGETE